jgi:hypothetical protein
MPNYLICFLGMRYKSTTFSSESRYQQQTFSLLLFPGWTRYPQFARLALRLTTDQLRPIRRYPDGLTVYERRLLNLAQATVVLGRTPAARHMVEVGVLKNATGEADTQIDRRDIDLLIARSKR